MTVTQIRLAKRPEGEPDDSCFTVVTHDEPPEPADGQVLLRVVYLSLDPYMRGRMSAAKSYADPVEVGDVLVGGTVCEVISSRHPDHAAGDFVLSYSGWQTHALADGSRLRKLDPSVVPLSTALGVLGMPGFTAYAGLLEIGKPQEGETVVVAAATGPVGSAVGQIAKLKGARAVGIAGGPDKCRALIEEFGFDAAVDHRSPTFAADLKAAVPDGVDVYFENVGGHVAAEVFKRMNLYGRVPVCGLVANYNATSAPEGPDRLPWVHGPGAAAEPDRARLHPGRVHPVARTGLRARHVEVGRGRLGALPRGRRRRAGQRPRGVPRAAGRPQLRQAPREGRRRPDPVTPG